MMEVSNKRYKRSSDADFGASMSGESTVQKSMGVLSGYSSSEDSDDEEKEVIHKNLEHSNEDNEEKDMDDNENSVQFEIVDDDEDNNESSDEENAIDLNDLESDSDDEKDEDLQSVYHKLFQDHGINPFGSWDQESLKLIKDPLFLKLDNNKERKAFFDKWSQNQIDNNQSNGVVEDSKDENGNDDVLQFKESSLVKLMKFIESIDEKDRLFIDFKKKHKDEINSITDNELSVKLIEKTYKELSIFFTKPQDFKIDVFNKIITNSKIFKKNLKDSIKNNNDEITRFKDTYNNDLENKFQEINDIDQLYNISHHLESILNISDSLINNTKYYIIDVKTRINLIWDRLTQSMMKYTTNQLSN